MTFSDLQKTLFELLQYRRTGMERTEQFGLLKHNSDLCPRLHLQLEQFLRSVERHRSVAYDTQGPSDAGVDVLLRLSIGENTKIIGFQIKADYEAKPGIYEKLKAQHHDAVNRYGNSLIDYYVLLCWEMPRRADMVRQVEQAFVGTQHVAVIEPTYSWTFLFELGDSQIEALTTAFLAESDPIVREARLSVVDMSLTQRLIFLFVLEAHTAGREQAVGLDALRSDARVMRAYATSNVLNLDIDVQLPLGTAIPRDFAAGEVDEIPSPRDIDALDPIVTLDERGSFVLIRRAKKHCSRSHMKAALGIGTTGAN